LLIRAGWEEDQLIRDLTSRTHPRRIKNINGLRAGARRLRFRWAFRREDGNHRVAASLWCGYSHIPTIANPNPWNSSWR
jgi:hypothetical protein